MQFFILSGRIKEYFKTIQGKFVAPTPIEAQFADNKYVEQQCLLGLGMTKTVMVAVVSETMRDAPKSEIEASVLGTIEAINAGVDMVMAPALIA